MRRKAVSGIMLILLLISMLTLAFNIQPVKSEVAIYIRPDGTVDPSSAPIQRDGDVYTFTNDIIDSIVVQRSNIIIDGNKYTLRGTLFPFQGIYLSNISNVTIKNTNIKGFDYGVYFISASNNTLSGNNITNNVFGIELRESSDNTVSGNNITNNACGIELWGSSNNVIFHNNFVMNLDLSIYIYESVNVWDIGYPSGGNYWSDYSGVDVKSGFNQDQLSSDGIGDTPYLISANNTDHYPLMYPYGAPPPPSYSLTIYSSPTGVTFTVDGVSCVTPWSATYYENASVTLEMPEIHVVGETSYYWSRWSDGVTSRSRTVTMETNKRVYGIHEELFPQPCVGGYMILIDKTKLPPSPWASPLISMVFLMVLATAISVVYVKHRKKQQT